MRECIDVTVGLKLQRYGMDDHWSLIWSEGEEWTKSPSINMALNVWHKGFIISRTLLSTCCCSHRAQYTKWPCTEDVARTSWTWWCVFIAIITALQLYTNTDGQSIFPDYSISIWSTGVELLEQKAVVPNNYTSLFGWSQWSDSLGFSF